MAVLKLIVSTFLIFSATGVAKESKKSDLGKKGSKMVYANFDTTEGKFRVQLFEKEAPKTVKNFIDLAEGTKEFMDPKSGKKVKRPYYDGLVFHRVIDGFMIQGGCPLGNGTGGPGYKFEDATKDSDMISLECYRWPIQGPTPMAVSFLLLFRQLLTLMTDTQSSERLLRVMM